MVNLLILLAVDVRIKIVGDPPVNTSSQIAAVFLMHPPLIKPLLLYSWQIAQCATIIYIVRY